MATINLGNIKFTWKGTYNAGTAYAVDDVVSYNGSSYVCIQASTNNLPTVTAYWDIMSSAGTNGTNGTDLTSTLTTQGDIVYKGASALERLAKGTTGQVLKQGANVPEWGTLSSDVVKIASNDTTPSGNVDYVDFQGIFDDSVYHSYKVIISEVMASSSNGAFLKLNFLDNSNNAYTSGTHIYIGKDDVYINPNSGSVTNGGNMEGVNAGYFRLTNWGGTDQSTNWPTAGELDIYGVGDSSVYSSIYYEGLATDSASPWFASSHCVGLVKTTTVFTGMRLSLGNNYFRKLNMAIYGMKK